MNHIYKVIFNKATGTFMAVAEYAKSHSTGGSCATGQVGSVCTLSFARIAVLAVLVIGATLSGSAYAQNLGSKIKFGTTGHSDDAQAQGEASLAIGSLAKADSNQSIAIGGSKPDPNNRRANQRAGSHAKGQESIAIGGDVLAEGDASIAIGSDDLYLNNKDGSHKHKSGMLNTLIQNHKVLSQIRNSTDNSVKYRRTAAEGHASTAVGAMSYAKGHFSNAFGTRATAEGNYSLAVGLTAQATKGYTIAIGSNAQAVNYGTLAIGADTQVNLDYGIALGYGSKILNNNNNNNNTAYIPEGGNSTINSSHKATTHGLFSIGSNEIRRKIINVGAGKDDTDAVNVAQLKAVENLAKRKITFKGDDNGTGVAKKLGETLTIKGGKSDANDLTENNIGVVKDNDTGLKVKLAKNLSSLETVSTKNLTASEKVTVGNGATAELLGGGLTFISSSTPPGTNSKTVYGIDGVKFTDSSDAALENTTRITKDKVGFSNKAGTVDESKPYLDKDKLKVGNSTLNNGGLTVNNTAGNQQIQVGADGIKFADVNGGTSVTVGTTRIAEDKIGFAGVDGRVDTAAPYLDKKQLQVGDVKITKDSGIDAGNQNISNVKDATKDTDAVTYKQLKQVQQEADGALQSFSIRDEKGQEFTISNLYSNGNTPNTFETITFAGENGISISNDIAKGKVKVGIDPINGLTTPKLTVGKDQNATQLVIEQVAGTNGNGDKNIIRGLSPTLPSITNAAGVRTTNQGNIITSDEDKSKAASIGDILNTGFNLKNNGEDKDFVSTYDTVDFIDGNATTAKVTYDEANQTSKVTYDVNVDNKTIELTGDNGTKNKIGVKTTKLTETSANGKATQFSATDGDALVNAKDIAENLNTLAGEIHTTKGTADTALQTFTVKKDGDDDANAITVGQNVNGNNAVSTLKLKGENGLTVATNKDGTVTFGINTQSGLKAGDSTTLNKDGLSIKNPTGNEQIQVGTDGIKFAKVDDKGAAGAAGAGIDGTSRITKDQIGFANSTGQVDINKPHLSKDGINAGGKKITNIQAGEIAKNSHDAVTGGQIYDLETELKNKISSTAKTAQNSLHEFSVADEHGNNFTVSNPYSSYDTSKTSDVITFAGENGITTKVNKGVVRVGIDQTKGLTTPKLTVGNNNGKGIVIDSQNGQNTITGLSNTLANVTNDGAGHALSQGLADNTDKTRAASIGDVLNAGFNLQGNGEAVDFVSTYDTVNFANGNATTAKVTYDDTKQTSTVTYDVNVDDKTLEVTGDKKLGVKTTTLTSTGTGANKFALSNQGTGDALVKASDIVAHLNTLSGDIQTAKGASQASSSAGYVDADGNKVIYDSTDNKYYQVNDKGQADKTKEVTRDKLVTQAQTPDGTLAQMNVKSVINKEQVNDANKKQGINEDNAFVKGLEKAASDNKTKNAAVTVGDLNAVAQTPLTFAGDTGTTAKKLGETLTIKGGQTDTNKLTDNNIGVVAGTDGFTVKLAKDLTNLNSVNAGGTKIDDKGVSFVDSSGQAKANTPVLSANGLDLGGKVISNVGKGTKDTDAANVQQLNEVRNLLGLGNAGNDNADGNQVNIADIKKDPNSGSSSNRIVIKAGTVLGGKGNNDTEKLATGGVQVGVDKDGNANGDLSNVWVKTQKDGSKKALLATYNAAGQTNYLTNNPAEAIDRINEQGIRFFHVNDGNQEPVVQGRNGIDSSASGKHSVAIGFQALADGEAAVAIGRQTQAGNQSIAIGDNAQATGDQSIAIGTGNVVAGKHSGAIGDPSTVKADNSYSVGNNNQMAMASMPQAYIPGRSMVTGGIATHNGQGAVAVGLSKLSDNGQWVFKINGSADTQGHVGAAVGAGFHF